jgi:hypothetical protein
VAHLYPLGTELPFCRLLQLVGLWWRYSNPPPHWGDEPYHIHKRWMIPGLVYKDIWIYTVMSVRTTRSSSFPEFYAVTVSHAIFILCFLPARMQLQHFWLILWITTPLPLLMRKTWWNVICMCLKYCNTTLYTMIIFLKFVLPNSDGRWKAFLHLWHVLKFITLHGSHLFHE